MTYTSKTYRSFVVSARGANSTVAATHAAWKYVTQRHVATVVGFGAEILAFVWGQKPQQVTDTDDYGFVTGMGIETLYGCKAIEDSAGNNPNYLIMKVYSKRP